MKKYMCVYETAKNHEKCLFIKDFCVHLHHNNKNDTYRYGY